jgi:DNA/RNA-binding domain of Phe-tRNA-synthetase-like protein
MVIARRWCWRQSAESASTLETTDTLITIEAHHKKGLEDVQNAIHEMVELLEKYAGGTYQVSILRMGNTVI